jgi:5-methylcytosine-specific restriction enzyme B
MHFCSGPSMHFLSGVDIRGSAELFKPFIDAIYAPNRPTRAKSEPDLTSFTLDDILTDGCFLERDELAEIRDRLYEKKNIILQGPPGTGKTWLGRRLAYALMGAKDSSRVRAVQFDPNMSYEDFARGWRPTADGKLALVDGIFMESIASARNNSAEIVVLIEEINRGNPAQIFGELLTLLEAANRIPQEALELSYPDTDGKRRPIYIPGNLFVIGTMNIADRSLAMVDLALRRRFAFVDLEPKFGPTWRSWVVENCNLAADLVPEIEQRIVTLNEQTATGSPTACSLQDATSSITAVTPGTNSSSDPGQSCPSDYAIGCMGRLQWELI